MTDRNAVFATEFWHGANGRALAQGFRDLGWCVDEVDMVAYFARGRTLASRIEARLFKAAQIAAYNEGILASARAHRASLMVTIKGGAISARTLATLRAEGVRTVNYYPDVGFGVAGFDEDRLADYDLIATTKSYHLPHLVPKFGAERVKFVHHGFSPLAHRRHGPAMPEDRDYAQDILYVGNASTYKRDWLARVAEALPDRTMSIVGHGWAAMAAGTSLERHVLGQPLVGDFYAREVGRSRINIGLHSGPWGPHRWEDLVSTRTFEIPACGGFMLHIDNVEVRTLFDVGTEIDVFATPDELVAKIELYLTASDERRAIAVRGHDRAWRDYTMGKRAAEIASILG